MKEDIKKRGWQQMKSLLDEEMPEKKKRYVLPLWLVLVLSGSTFFFGYYLSDTRRNLSPAPIAYMSEPEDPSVPDPNSMKLEYSTQKDIPLPEFQGKSLAETLSNTAVKERNNRVKARDFSQRNTKNANTGIQQPFTSFAQSAAIPEKNPVPETPKQIPVKIMGNQTGAGKQQKILITESLPVSFSAIKTSEKMIFPLLVNPKNNPWFTQVSSSLGIGLNSSGVLSASIGGHVLYKKRNNIFHAGTGYRYIRANYSEILQSGNLDSGQMSSENKNPGWELFGIHQVFVDVGIRHQWQRSWYVGAGLLVPVIIAKNSGARDAFSFNAESDPASGPGNNITVSNSNGASNVRSWDLQPYITIGKNITREISIFSTIQAGLWPVNKKPLESQRDIRWHQFSMGLHYTL